MAHLTISWSDLYTTVSEFVGLGSSPTGDNLTKVKDITFRGLRRFYYPTFVDPVTRKPKPYLWSFLKQYHTFSTVSGGWKYALPIDYSELLTDISYSTGTGYNPLTERSPQQIMDMRVESDSSGYPEYFAIVPLKYDNEIGTFYELWLYPEPDGAYQLQMFYKIDPLKPEETTDFLPGGVKSAEAIIESCLAVAEQQEDDTIGLHTQLAGSMVQNLILHDNQPETDKIGNLYNGNRAWPKERSRNINVDEDNVYSAER